jgi:PAS domain S-box-containing protein
MLTKIGKYIHPKSLAGTFLIFAILLFLYSYIEYKQTQKNLFQLLKNQIHTTLEITVRASENTMSGNILLEEEIEKRLLAASRTVYRYDSLGTLSDQLLKQIAEDHHLYGLLVIDEAGRIIFSNLKHTGRENVPMSVRNVIRKFLASGETYSTGNYFQVPEQNQYRYALFYRLDHSRVIIANINAEELLEFRRQSGFGSLIRKIAQNQNVVYAALQDTSGILAASSNVKELSAILSDSVLKRSYFQKIFAIHFTNFENQKVIEAVQPLIVENEVIGIFRIGISTAPLDRMNQRAIRRFILSTLVLIFLGGILSLLMLIQQNYQLIRKQYQEVETFSQSILQHMSDGVIITDESEQVLLMNPVMANVLGIHAEDAIGRHIGEIVPEDKTEIICDGTSSIKEIHLSVNGKEKIMLLSGTIIRSEGRKFCVRIIRDITEQKYLQEQIARKERLMAMGQLASGVAHEIRNPLNTIATLAQQIDMDFKVTEDEEEFHQLMQIIRNEIHRLNDTVEHFLKLARPEPLHPEEFDLKELLDELWRQYMHVADQRLISFRLLGIKSEIVYWDRSKMKQVLINLLNNALDAVKENGSIQLTIDQPTPDIVEIRIKDNGQGMEEDVLSRIFNAYFTTKPQGTGLGLSVVQQIIDLHQGTVHVNSEKNVGTEFIIRLPRRVPNGNKE